MMRNNSDSLKQGFVLLSIIILIISSPCLVQAKEIYGDWHYTGDTFTVEGDVYTVTHYNFYDTSVILGVNNNNYVIREGDCKLTPTMEYCVDEIYNDIENADENDPIKFEKGVAYAGIRIIISTRGPDISVSRSFSTTEPELNQEVAVTVTVENTGSEAAQSFIYTDSFPEGVIITSSSSGTKRTSRSLTYEAKSISINTEKTFTYTFKMTDYLEFTDQPRATYTYNGIENNVSVSDKTIKVVKPYEFTATLSPESIEASDQSALSIKVENTVSDDIDVNELRITIPSFLSLQAKPGELEKKNEKYYWNGSIEPDKYKMINLLLKPGKSGTYKIPVSIIVSDSEGEEFSEIKNISLTSTIKGIEPILSVLDTSVSEGSNFRVAFSVKNPNEKVGFRNIKASVKSELFPELKAELEELMPGKTKTLIVNDTLTAPFLDQKKSYDIEALGTYDTTTNEHFEFSKKEVLTVSPVSEAISITQDVNKKELVPGENVTITIKINNNNMEAVEVSVNDTYSENASLIGGKTSKTLYFDSAGTKQAYTYNLQVPLTYNKTELVITTSASIRGKQQVNNKNTTINVILPGHEEEEGVLEESAPEPQKVQKKEEKPDFFKKIINVITDFFKRLLGKT